MTRALGPGAGHTAGWGLVLGYLFTGSACILGFEIYGDEFLTGLGLSPANHVARALLYVAGGLVVGMVLAIFAFVGFESAGALGQEARNPARSVPRSILWSCGIVGVFCLIVACSRARWRA